ncbi:MAG: response regulator [Planctomycetes bacterium]|nr:response regulator [Planctomycetota bacterium]
MSRHTLSAPPATRMSRAVVESLGARTILVVDDEPTMRLIAQRVLGMRGYRVLTAADGEEAAEICESYEGTIDLVLTDVVMPGIGGRELGRRVAVLRPGAKLVYMSILAGDAAVEYGVSTASESFLQKPFTPGALMGKVQAALL